MTRSLMRQCALWTAVLLFSVYFLTTGGEPFVSDGEVMLITAIRLVDHRSVALEDRAGLYDQTITRADGAVFSRYGLGQPLAAAPLYGLGRYVVGRLLRVRDEYAFGRFSALLLPAMATAATGGLVTAWACSVYRSPGVGIGLGVLFGLATLAWPYSRFFFSEALFGLLLVAAAFALFSRHPLGGGLALGLAVATRVGGLALLPAFLLYAWMKGERASEFIRMAIGLAPGGALVLLNNWIRFGALTERAYGEQGFTGNLLVGLYGLLLSPGKSVFLYVPLLVVLPFSFRAFGRRCRSEMALIGALAVITLVQSALWWAWWGGWSWGPRLLVPLMPFAVLPMGELLGRRAWRWLIGGVLVPLSLGVSVLGILVDFNDYFVDLGAEESRAFFEPEYSPILEHFRRVDAGAVPMVSFRLDGDAATVPQPWALLTPIGWVCLGAAAGGMLWKTVRTGRSLSARSGVRR